DWEGDSDNKLVAGQDVLSARPTLLLALALEGSDGATRQELLDLIQRASQEPRGNESALTRPDLERVRRIFQKAEVFDKAEKLVEKYRARAEAVADEVEPTELRELLYFLVDSVLERQSPAEPELASLPLVQLS